MANKTHDVTYSIHDPVDVLPWINNDCAIKLNTFLQFATSMQRLDSKIRLIWRLVRKHDECSFSLLNCSQPVIISDNLSEQSKIINEL